MEPNRSSPGFAFAAAISALTVATAADFVIDGKLPAQAKIAILGDWGTGQDAAKLVLRQIMNKNPDVVIHLGDIYYAGTQFEVTNYFLQPWQQILNLGPKLDRIPTFTLAGNHDMYSGGVPYYQLIGQLGQPASYFCLRNTYWQFVALDTGYNDHNPAAAGAGATFLQDPEVAWLADKVNNGGVRNTVLLSHHQLFTGYDNIANKEVNLRLYPQVLIVFAESGLLDLGPRTRFCALRLLPESHPQLLPRSRGVSGRHG